MQKNKWIKQLVLYSSKQKHKKLIMCASVQNVQRS